MHLHILYSTIWSHFNKHVCGSKIGNAFNYAFLLVFECKKWDGRKRKQNNRPKEMFPINILILFVLSICVCKRCTRPICKIAFHSKKHIGEQIVNYVITMAGVKIIQGFFLLTCSNPFEWMIHWIRLQIFAFSLTFWINLWIESSLMTSI